MAFCKCSSGCRFIAVAHPIRYAKHRNSKRVYVTLALTWIVSLAISSPIALGMNYTERRKQTPTLCTFYNSDFLIYSSMGSFYIPSIIMVGLYWRIFLTIRQRIKGKITERKSKCPSHAKPCRHKRTGSAANTLQVVSENSRARAAIARNENMADMQEAREDNQYLEDAVTAVSPNDVPKNEQMGCLTDEVCDDKTLRASSLADVNHADESKEDLAINDKTCTVEKLIQTGIEVGFVLQLGGSAGAERTRAEEEDLSKKRETVRAISCNKRKGFHHRLNHPHNCHSHQQQQKQQSAGSRFNFFVRHMSDRRVHNRERVFSKNEKKATKTLAIVLGEQTN